MRTVEQEQVATAELGLPPSVQAALGELVNAAKDGLLALSVGVGLGVLSTLMEEEVTEGRRAEGPSRPRSHSGPSRAPPDLPRRSTPRQTVCPLSSSSATCREGRHPTPR